MTIEIKNEPLRLVYSHLERAIIDRHLRAARRQCVVWAIIAALGAGAVLGGAQRYGEVPQNVLVDRVFAEIGHAPSDNMSAAACGGVFRIYRGTRRVLCFCDEDPQHVIFHARLKAAVEAQGLWADVNCLQILVGFFALLVSLFGVAEALLDIWKYWKYADDLDAFLRRFNRAG